MEENFEMPTPCIHCGEIFDLNDGYASEKWHKDIIICRECHQKEEQEIENDERWETINAEVSNAMYELKEEGAWQKLTKENRELIINCMTDPLEQLVGKQSNWLMIETNLPVEKIVDFRQKFIRPDEELHLTEEDKLIVDLSNLQMVSATDFKKEWLNEPNHCPVLVYPTAPVPTALIEENKARKQIRRI
jgi:hypothetical protein